MMNIWTWETDPLKGLLFVPKTGCNKTFLSVLKMLALIMKILLLTSLLIHANRDLGVLIPYTLFKHTAEWCLTPKSCPSDSNTKSLERPWAETEAKENQIFPFLRCSGKWQSAAFSAALGLDFLICFRQEEGAGGKTRADFAVGHLVGTLHFPHLAGKLSEKHFLESMGLASSPPPA